MYSRELNVDSTGQPRIYVNDSDLTTLLDKLTTALGEDLANFIIAYRMYGPSTQGSSGGSSSGSSSQPGSSQPSANPTSGNQPSSNQPSGSPSSGGQSSSSRTGSSGSTQGSQGGGASGQLTRNNLGNMQNQSSSSRSISSLYELINAKVSIPSSQPNQPAQVYTSPIGDGGSIREYLPLLLDKLTTVRDQELPARVNVMTAPEAVLLALPNLEEADVQAILSSRPSLSSTMSSDLLYQTPAWLMTDANIPVQTMRSLERYITARSQVYRVQSIGHFEGGGPTARIEAVIDVNAGRPRIVYWRDLTELGKVINLQNANAQTPTEN
jgi:hypothetical protein